MPELHGPESLVGRRCLPHGRGIFPHNLNGITAMTFDDTFHTYRISPKGIQVEPHDGKWSGYYRAAEQWELTLTGIAFGAPPGILTIPIRSWEDIARKSKATHPA